MKLPPIAICATLAALYACSSRAPVSTARSWAPPPPGGPVVMAADRQGLGIGRFHYVGRWQFVRGRRDGRINGQSARSFHLADSVSVAFEGRRIRVYGVTGPGGGYGTVGLDDRIVRDAIDFYSPRKHTHALLYSSPLLPDGIHALAVLVSGDRNPHSRGTYLNVESAEVEDLGP